MMTDTILRAVFQRRPYTNAVADELLRPKLTLDFVEVDLIAKAMEGVCDLEYDIGEVTLTDYMICRDLNKPIVGIPVFVTRNFLHDRIWVNTRAGIKSPKDLEGKRVGLKSYTQTAPFWNRTILSSEYGVDLSKITWVNIEDGHVRDYRNPANVIPAPAGATLATMLEAGEIDAADDPARPFTDREEKWDYDPELIKPLMSDSHAASADWYKRTQVYPILHMIVVKQSALQRFPSLAADLFNAFCKARDAWMQQITNPAVYRQRGRDIVGRDFLPYGVEANRATLEFACKHAYEQGVTAKLLGINDLFSPEITSLRG